MIGASVQIPSAATLMIGQTGIVPGHHDATAIATLLARVKGLRFAAGDHTFSGPILITSAHNGCKIRGEVGPCGQPSTRFLRSDSPSTSLADDRTNACVLIQGTIGSAINTTVGSSAPARSNIVRLAASVSAAAGSFVLLSGDNAIGVDEGEQSEGSSVISWEIIQAAAAVSGTDITTAWDTCEHHSNGAQARDVVPVQDFELSGIDFACDGGTVAVGVLIRLAIGVRLDNIWGAGLSRAIVDIEDGAMAVTYGRIHSRGECGSALLGRSFHHVAGTVVDSDLRGKRLHAHGVPRHLVDMDQACTHSDLGHVFASHCIGGVRCQGGGSHVHFDHIQAKDCDITSVQASSDGGGGRNPEILPGDFVGIALDLGDFGPLATAAFGQSFTCDSIDAFDCTFAYDGSHENLAYGVLLHDTFHLSIGQVDIVNNGQSGINNDLAGHQRRCNGLRMQDVNGRVAGGALRDAAKRKKKLVDRDLVLRVSEALVRFD
jgi:hypothetical protein